MINAVKLALNNYAIFHGRTKRADYWFFWLFTLLASIVAAKIDTVLSSSHTYVQSLAELFLFIPSIATGTRRMHDVNKRGWWLIVPFLNIFFLVQKSGPLNEFDL